MLRLLPFSLLLLLVLPVSGSADIQGKRQQQCINGQNRRGADLAREQGRVALRCLRDASRGRSDRLAGSGQPATAQACLANDVRGKLARRAARLAKSEERLCSGDAPGFAYRSAADIDPVARDEAIALVGDLLGPDLDAAVVPASKRHAARCQRDALRATHGYYDELWKVARRAKADALAGRRRAIGPDPERPSSDATDLLAEIIARLEADEKGKLARKRATLARRFEKRCSNTALDGLFPGGCAGSVDATALAECATSAATGRFYRSLAGFDALRVPCDLEDDGRRDFSCVEPSLEAHVLDRAGYGWSAWSLARLRELGIEGYLEEQLDPGSIEEDPELGPLLAARYPSLALHLRDLIEQYPKVPEDPELPDIHDVPDELQEAALLTRVMTRRQLEVALVDFWFNHFSIDVNFNRRRWYATVYWRDSIRPHVLGRYADLVLASARGPAMADYLDNRLNNVVDGINENYARELLELHTLSVDGPYDEEDIVEVARMLTGWVVNETKYDPFDFTPYLHDFGEKTVLGTVYPEGVGAEEGATLIDRLAVHPSTAAHIARKLLVRFVSEEPSQAQIDAVAEVFLTSGGDLRAVTRAVLLSDAFLLDPGVQRGKVKRPHHLYVSAARALGADPTALDLGLMRQNVRNLGEPLFDAKPPTGHPEVSEAWSGPGALITRLAVLEKIARGLQGFTFDLGIPPEASDAEVVDGMVEAVFLAPVSETTRTAVIGYLGELPPGLTPEERHAQALALLLSSPEFGTH